MNEHHFDQQPDESLDDFIRRVWEDYKDQLDVTVIWHMQGGIWQARITRQPWNRVAAPAEP